MKQFLLIILVSISSISVQSQNLRTTIKIQAMDMARALIADDFNAFSKYIHPNIMQYAGGKAKLKSAMDSAAIAMKQFSVSFKKILIGDPGEVINYKKQLQCVVPESTDMLSPLGTMHLETSLVAISLNNGKDWYFIDTNVYRADKLKTTLPDLSPNLMIPPQQKPTFTPNEN